MIHPSNILIESYPDVETRGGMFTGMRSVGVKATYIPTGQYATCNEFRAQYENRQAAIKQLEYIVYGLSDI